MTTFFASYVRVWTRARLDRKCSDCRLFLMAYTSILLGYVEMALTWMYPDFPLWGGALMLVLLTVYALYGGGFRLVAGVSFLTFL